MTSPELAIPSPWGRLYRTPDTPPPGTSATPAELLHLIRRGELMPSVTNIAGIGIGGSGSGLEPWHGWEAARTAVEHAHGDRAARDNLMPSIFERVASGDWTPEQGHTATTFCADITERLLAGSLTFDEATDLDDLSALILTRTLKGDLTLGAAREFIVTAYRGDRSGVRAALKAVPSAWALMKKGSMDEATLDARRDANATALMAGSPSIGLMGVTASTLSQAFAGAARRSAHSSSVTGTAVHAIAEAYAAGADRGEHGIEVTPAMEPFVAALHDFLDTGGYTFLHSEVTCFGVTANHPQSGDAQPYAGTADALVGTTHGISVLDYKTKKAKSFAKTGGDYPVTHRQLSALAHTEWFVDANGGKQVMPEVVSGVAVFLLDDGTWQTRVRSRAALDTDFVNFTSRRHLWHTDVA